MVSPSPPPRSEDERVREAIFTGKRGNFEKPQFSDVEDDEDGPLIEIDDPKLEDTATNPAVQKRRQGLHDAEKADGSINTGNSANRGSGRKTDKAAHNRANSIDADDDDEEPPKKKTRQTRSKHKTNSSPVPSFTKDSKATKTYGPANARGNKLKEESSAEDSTAEECPSVKKNGRKSKARGGKRKGEVREPKSLPNHVTIDEDDFASIRTTDEDGNKLDAKKQKDAKHAPMRRRAEMIAVITDNGERLKTDLFVKTTRGSIFEVNVDLARIINKQIDTCECFLEYPELCKQEKKIIVDICPSLDPKSAAIEEDIVRYDKILDKIVPRIAKIVETQKALKEAGSKKRKVTKKGTQKTESVISDDIIAAIDRALAD